MRFAPFAFPLRTAVATRGPHLHATLGSTTNPVNPRGPRPVDNLWMRMWTMRNGRGEPWETALRAVDEVGKMGGRRAPYLPVTCHDVVRGSSTGCGQKVLTPNSAERVGR